MSARANSAFFALLTLLVQPAWTSPATDWVNEAYDCKGKNVIPTGNQLLGQGTGTAELACNIKTRSVGLLLGVPNQLVVLGVSQSPEQLCLVGKRAPRATTKIFTDGCTATLVGQRLIVTAEHCLGEPYYYFYPGFVSDVNSIHEQNQQRIAVEKVIFQSGQYGDIALLQLKSAPEKSIERMQIATHFIGKPLPLDADLDFYGIPKKTALVWVKGSKTLANQAFLRGSKKPNANLFCAATDQGNGMSGGPYVYHGKILGVLHGGPLDYFHSCGLGCESGDFCFAPITNESFGEYFGDSATRADMLCDANNVTDSKIRAEIGCPVTKPN